MRRSLRWRLQGWYALVLLAVVGGFASLLYAQVRSARFQEIDAALTADALYLDTSLRAFPLHELEGRPPPDRPRDRPFDGPRPPRLGPPPGPPRPGPNRDRLFADLTLPPRTEPDRESPGATYFAVWRADGSVLKSAN